MANRFFKFLRVTNVLSFGPGGTELELRPLNLLIGPNGSGKSNVLEVLRLLQAAPSDLAAPMLAGGGVEAWIHKGAAGQRAHESSLESLVTGPKPGQLLAHRLSFRPEQGQLYLLDESVHLQEEDSPPTRLYGLNDGHPVIRTASGAERSLDAETIPRDRSILQLRRDPDHYPELTYLAEQYASMRLYRDWTLGIGAPGRAGQRPNGRAAYLSEDGANLPVVLGRLAQDDTWREAVLQSLDQLIPGLENLESVQKGGALNLQLRENGVELPAARFSDGTLRFLALQAMLRNPELPPVLCVEEPELGLHPDALPELATLLLQAAERCQVIATTHSKVLLDAFGEAADSVVVVEKQGQSTQFERLDQERLNAWLGNYALGTLWTMGEIGGNRW